MAIGTVCEITGIDAD